MKPFEYIAPASVDEACRALHMHGEGARILAGGTDLLVELRRPTVASPGVVVDISRIVELRGIVEEGSSILIRPLTTHSDLLRSPLLRMAAPLLSKAAAAIGSPQIRNRGTVGGNIMNGAACADTVPPLIALGAVATLSSAGGERTVDLQDLFIKPYETRATAEELLTAIRFQKPPATMRGTFLKLGRRNALSISRLSVASLLDREAGGRIREARIVPGAAFPTWMRITEAEEMLVGNNPSRELFDAAGRIVSDVMIGYTGRRWSTEYKEPVLAVLVRRALEACCEG